MSSAWSTLCETLCPGDGSLYEEVRQAEASPRDYLARFREALLDRGIERAAEVEPWLALVDGLARRERLQEFDHRLHAETLADGLEQLHPAQQQAIVLTQLRKNDKRGEALLQAAAEELGAWRLGLLSLDIASDSYPLTMAPLDDVATVTRLASSLGRRVESFSTAA